MNLINTKIKNDSIFFSTQIPIVMGILNLTTDSFYDGGNYLTDEKIILKVKNMLDEGASIIDIGAQSSKPGAIQMSSKEELKKILPTIKLLKSKFKNIVISVDTFWSNTAKQSVLKGANIINDISAGEIDKNMLRTIAKLNVPYIMMHMQGNPDNMQKNPQYGDVVEDIKNWLEERIKTAEMAGIKRSDIIVDPGIGFGKNLKHNLELLGRLNEFKGMAGGLLLGASRKSFIAMMTGNEEGDRLSGSLSAAIMGVTSGVDILRVHDVKETLSAVNTVNSL